MSLIVAVALLGIAVLFGLVLGSMYLLRDAPPATMPKLGWVHGTLGVAGVIVLIVALQGAARGLPQGAGSFGTLSGALLAATLAGGLWILATRLRRRPVSPLLVTLHASIGVAGYVILAAYFAYPVSYKPQTPASAAFPR